MKALSVARKTVRELWREPQLFLLLLIFPALLIGLYYFAFGQTEKGMSQLLRVLVLNRDAGAAVEGQAWRAGDQLVEAMRQAEFDGKPAFDVNSIADEPTGAIALREGKASLLLIIPPDFSAALLAARAGATEVPAVAFAGDPASDFYVFAQSFLEDMVRQFAASAVGRPAEPAVDWEFVPGTGTMSDFQFGVPGMLVFGLLFMMLTTATVLVREHAYGTLQRLRLTPARAADLLVGVSLAQLVAAVVQVLVSFGTATIFGFQFRGSLLLAIGICILFGFTAIGLGLIVACLARNDGEAVNLVSGLIVPLAFLSGAIFPMPAAPLLTLFGQTIEAYDILPSTHAAEALRRVLIFGDGPAAIAYELIALALLSALLLGLGVVLYTRLRLRRA